MTVTAKHPLGAADKAALDQHGLFGAVELSSRDFTRISRFLHSACGIKLSPGKEGLVKSRLMKRLRALDLKSYSEYMQYVERDSSGRERTLLIDALTTNKTSFFREGRHFDYLRTHILPRLRASRKVRIWSAGCSSGEEPYSLAILFHEEWPDLHKRDVRILATDISTNILSKAREAIYEGEVIDELAGKLKQKYFTCLDASNQAYRLRESVQHLVTLALLNLISDWPMKGPFDVILCRNVMIYFDQPTQQRLVRRFWNLLAPGGHLFLGHSESLMGAGGLFRYIQPAIYAKEEILPAGAGHFSLA